MRTAALALASLLALACGSADSAMGQRPILGEFVDEDAGRSAIRYFDTDAVSLNDVCPVTRDRLNPVIEPLYVNGRPIGFC